MGKEQFLESLLSSGESLDKYANYTKMMNFACSYSLLKVREIDEDDIGEYFVFKNLDVLTYKRVHACLLKKGEDSLMYLFKNSVPFGIKYMSEGNDRDLLSNKLVNELLATAKSFDDKAATNVKAPFKYFRIRFDSSRYKDDIYGDREYILDNIRKNANGEVVCWHIYPDVNGNTVILDILEHPSVLTKEIFNPDNRNEIEEDKHFVPLEKDKDNWKNYIPL